MIGGAVVTLAIVLPDQLPIALLDDGAFEGDLRFPQAMRREIGRDRLAERPEVHRVFGKTDEDVTADGLAVDRLQTVLGRVEALGHLPREEQAAVEFVGPLVVGTDEFGG